MCHGVDEVLSAGGHDQIFLRGGVDADDAVAHAARGDLAGDVAESAAGAGNDYPLPGFGVAAAESGVGGYAGAEHGCGVGGGYGVGDRRYIAVFVSNKFSQRRAVTYLAGPRTYCWKVPGV